MIKADIVHSLIVRAKNTEKNKQGQRNEYSKTTHWQYYKFARVTSLKSYYSSIENKTVTYVYYVPFNAYKLGSNSEGLVSCSTLSEFKKEFKHLKFNKLIPRS